MTWIISRKVFGWLTVFPVLKVSTVRGLASVSRLKFSREMQQCDVSCALFLIIITNFMLHKLLNIYHPIVGCKCHHWPHAGWARCINKTSTFHKLLADTEFSSRDLTSNVNLTMSEDLFIDFIAFSSIFEHIREFSIQPISFECFDNNSVIFFDMYFQSSLFSTLTGHCPVFILLKQPTANHWSKAQQFS